MLNNERTNSISNSNILGETPSIRDIHALTPSPRSEAPSRESWETNSRRRRLSSYLSTESSSNYSDAHDDHRSFASISSDQISALVMVGSTETTELTPSYRSIGEDDHPHEESINPLAIMPRGSTEPDHGDIHNNGEVSVQRVKKEEVECKINAWQDAEISKISNRFKREIAIIKGVEGEQVEKATLWMKKVERKLEEKRAKALEKMQNDMANAQRKAEEKRASAEGKRGTQVAKVLEIANFMRVIGRPPVKRSFF